MPSKKDGHFGLILACVYSSTNRQGDNQNSVFAYCLTVLCSVCLYKTVCEIEFSFVSVVLSLKGLKSLECLNGKFIICTFLGCDSL